ncbi:MAG: neutral zinc metallopeptidase [Pseudomonadota bacterium]
MRWEGRRKSRNVEDRRGQSARYAAAGAAPLLLRFLPAMIRSKTGRVILIVGLVAIVGGNMMGIDVLGLLTGSTSMGPAQASRELTQEEQRAADFVSVVLADTEDTWHRIFQERGETYREPTLVLFSGRVNSACGSASSAVGPFYCPADKQLYIDLTFFDELATRFGAPGDFAQAYVVAHEVGHHVQTLLGISEQVRAAGRGKDPATVNALSVRQELQADCFAGLWGHAANTQRQMLDPGDLEEALQAATAIGDDTLARQAGAAVVPDSFTHGTSAQRVQWFRRGFESGDITQCDTFNNAI